MACSFCILVVNETFLFLTTTETTETTGRTSVVTECASVVPLFSAGWVTSNYISARLVVTYSLLFSLVSLLTANYIITDKIRKKS